jgi:hypothetical protein
MVFTVGATNPNTGLTSTATLTVNVTGVVRDNVAVTKATWANLTQNRGVLNVVAASDAPFGPNGLPPAGLQLYIQARASVATQVPDGSGGLVSKVSEVQLGATPLPMFFGATGSPAACPAGVARCWQFVTRGALQDPNRAGVFVPPDTVTVTSSFGGSGTATKTDGSIQLQ